MSTTRLGLGREGAFPSTTTNTSWEPGTAQLEPDLTGGRVEGGGIEECQP